MFGQILSMSSFSATVHPESITNTTTRGLLTACALQSLDVLGYVHWQEINSILELGAWVGVLVNGLLADALGRQQATLSGVVVFIVGVIVQACAKNADYILGGRFVTGLGVGILSMIVPL